MKQKSTVQIREELRKDMNKMFEKKYQYLIDDLEKYKKLYNDSVNEKKELMKEVFKLTEENAALKEKITQYEDWIERLQDFMDIEDEKARKVAFETYIKEKQSRAELEDLMNVYCNMFNKIFTY